MARSCSICTNPEREAIDRAIVAGESSNRRIATQFGITESAVRRHQSDHIPAHIARAQAATEVADADDLLSQIKTLRNRAMGLLDKAEAAGDFRTALAGIREARACIETLLEVEGELDRRADVNITLSPDWLTLRTLILDVLRSFPEARTAVASRLLELESGL